MMYLKTSPRTSSQRRQDLSDSTSSFRMANVFWRNFHLCFSPKFIKYSSTSSLPSISSPSKPENRGRPSFLVNTSIFPSTTSYDFDPDMVDSPEADLNAAFASPRFFFSSPGHSNSIFDSSNTNTTSATNTVSSTHSAISINTATISSETADTAFSGCPVDTPDINESFAVEQLYSADPYRDFKQSMEEMISAIGEGDDGVSEKLLHDLLFYYLYLNPEHTHKFILQAFWDTLVPRLLSPESLSSDW